MKKKTAVLLLSGLMLSGCSSAYRRTESQKSAIPEQGQETQKVSRYADISQDMKNLFSEGERPSVINRNFMEGFFVSPYAQYSLDTGDTEIWFYEDFYVVFAGDASYLKLYDGAAIDKSAE